MKGTTKLVLEYRAFNKDGYEEVLREEFHDAQDVLDFIDHHEISASPEKAYVEIFHENASHPFSVLSIQAYRMLFEKISEMIAHHSTKAKSKKGELLLFKRFVDDLPEESYLKGYLKELPEYCYKKMLSDEGCSVLDDLKTIQESLFEKERIASGLRVQLGNTINELERTTNRFKQMTDDINQTKDRAKSELDI